jgi:glycosyltransferase involved in cell wall biosynthesis
MDAWEREDFGHMNGYDLDTVICMRFPAYYLRHPNKVVWMIHQHRAVYDLWDTPYSDGISTTREGRALRREIFSRDHSSLRTCRKIFTISKAVSDRLMQYNKIPSMPLYHPPPNAECIYSKPAEPYILAPSRLETLKRLDLLIRAMQYVRSPVVALVAGDGGQRANLIRQIEDLGLGRKVRLLGHITERELPDLYARCLAVFFGPHREDMGYITLEAMLAAKPVITCTDSGGPLEFVVNGETGFIVPPEPRQVAEAIERLSDRKRASSMGSAGRDRYHEMGISWVNVLEALLTGGPT